MANPEEGWGLSWFLHTCPRPNPINLPPTPPHPVPCPLQPSRSLPWGMEFFLADSNRAPFYTPISDWIIHADRGLAAKDTV